MYQKKNDNYISLGFELEKVEKNTPNFLDTINALYRDDEGHPSSTARCMPSDELVKQVSTVEHVVQSTHEDACLQDLLPSRHSWSS